VSDDDSGDYSDPAAAEEVRGPGAVLGFAVISAVCGGVAYLLSGWKPQEYFWRGSFWLNSVIFCGVSAYLAVSLVVKRLRRGRW
jgi:hypothetical protein